MLRCQKIKDRRESCSTGGGSRGGCVLCLLPDFCVSLPQELWTGLCPVRRATSTNLESKATALH